MLLRVNTSTRVVFREIALPLREFRLNGRDLQAILFEQPDRLLPDDDLLLIAQSRRRPVPARGSADAGRRVRELVEPGFSIMGTMRALEAEAGKRLHAYLPGQEMGPA